MKFEELRDGDIFTISSGSRFERINGKYRIVGQTIDGCIWSWPNLEITLEKRKYMNVIEALQAIQNGKKIRRIDWTNGFYIYLEEGRFKGGGNAVPTIYNLSSLEENGWEEYIEPPV